MLLTFMDDAAEILYFNWTCGGMEITFRGTYLAAEFHIIPELAMRRTPGEGPGTIGCREALKQIRDRRYEEILIKNGMSTIYRYGIACYKKQCRVVSEITEI